MRVRFWGVRGSVAAPGPATVRYGGNTVCVEVRTAGGDLIVLDAGTGIRPLGDELAQAPLPDPIHLFITHAHWDHIIGAPFFAPIWRKDARIVLHALSPRAEKAIAKMALFDGEHFPVRASDIPSRLERPVFTAAQVRVGSAVVSRVFLNHPGGCDGFRVDDEDGTSVCYLTDNELEPGVLPSELARFAAGADLVIHDAQYLPADFPAKRGWGHSCVDDVLALGREAGARRLVLHHHDPARTDAALDDIGAGARAWAEAHAPAMAVDVAAEGASYDLTRRG